MREMIGDKVQVSRNVWNKIRRLCMGQYKIGRSTLRDLSGHVVVWTASLSDKSLLRKSCVALDRTDWSTAFFPTTHTWNHIHGHDVCKHTYTQDIMINRVFLGFLGSCSYNVIIALLLRTVFIKSRHMCDTCRLDESWLVSVIMS